MLSLEVLKKRCSLPPATAACAEQSVVSTHNLKNTLAGKGLSEVPAEVLTSYQIEELDLALPFHETLVHLCCSGGTAFSP